MGLTGALVLGFIGSFYAYEGLVVLFESHPAPASEDRFPSGSASWRRPSGSRVKRLVATGHSRAGRFYRQGSAQSNSAILQPDQIVLIYPRLSIRLTELVTPLKPLEAMAQGRLLLASDVGGHRELIRQGETGTLFKAGDPAALASAVLELVGHPERWARVKSNARRFVETERTWHASVARYRSVYGALAKDHSRSFIETADAPVQDAAALTHMCGIHGIVHLDGNRPDTAALSRMARVTAHRGPDDEGMHATVHARSACVDFPLLISPAAISRCATKTAGMAGRQWRNLQLSRSAA